MTTRAIRRSTILSAHGSLGLLRAVHGSSVVKRVAPANVSFPSLVSRSVKLGVVSRSEFAPEGPAQHHAFPRDDGPDPGRDTSFFAHARQNQSMKPPKAMTIRLSAEQAEALETVATVDDMAVVEVIRAAIAEHVEARKLDTEFQRGLRERIERAQSLLEP